MFDQWAQEKLTREQRLYQFQRVIQDRGRVGVTATMWCRLCGLKRTPYTMGIITELWEQGGVVFEDRHLTNGMPVRVFWWSDTYWSEVSQEGNLGPQEGQENGNG